MNKLFIPAKIKEFDFDISILKKLPKNLIVAYSIQYIDIARQIREKLSKSHDILKFIQVLGCMNPSLSEKVQAVLLIGSGKFHAVSLALETGKEIYLFEHGKLIKISDLEIDSLRKKQKAAQVNFLNSDKCGVLISLKPGQHKLKEALKLKNKIKDKKIYFFISDNLDVGEFENFGIASWINTACPRMDMNSNKIINISKL